MSPKERLKGHILTSPNDPSGSYIVLCPKCRRADEALGEQFNVVREIRGSGDGMTPEQCHGCGKTLQRLSKDWS